MSTCVATKKNPTALLIERMRDAVDVMLDTENGEPDAGTDERIAQLEAFAVAVDSMMLQTMISTMLAAAYMAGDLDKSPTSDLGMKFAAKLEEALAVLREGV